MKERPYVEDKDCDKTQDKNDAIENLEELFETEQVLGLGVLRGK